MVSKSSLARRFSGIISALSLRVAVLDEGDMASVIVMPFTWIRENYYESQSKNFFSLRL